MDKYLKIKKVDDVVGGLITGVDTSSENSLIIEHFKHNSCTGFKTDR